MSCPRSFYICSGRSGGVCPLRAGIEAQSSDQVGLFGAWVPPRRGRETIAHGFKPWVSGDERQEP